MRVMVLVKATADSENGFTPSAWTTEMMAGGLKPTSEGKRIAFEGASRTVIDGPFFHTRELVAGFWLWEVKDIEEAVAWVRRCPNPMPGPSEIEIRTIYVNAELEAGGGE